MSRVAPPCVERRRVDRPAPELLRCEGDVAVHANLGEHVVAQQRDARECGLLLERGTREQHHLHKQLHMQVRLDLYLSDEGRVRKRVDTGRDPPR